jgi:hypothetical protein
MIMVTSFLVWEMLAIGCLAPNRAFSLYRATIFRHPCAINSGVKMQSFWLGVVGLIGALTGPVWAQSGVAGPAEMPPADYAGRSYVDSTGCVFQRAGVSGTMIWVPYLSAERTPICGKTPSLADQSAGILATDAIAEAPKAAPAVATAPQSRKRSKPHNKPLAGPVTFVGPVTLVEITEVEAAHTLCPASVGTAQQLLISDGRRVTNCGAAVGDGVAYINRLEVPGLHVTGSDFTDGAQKSARAAGQAGYRVVWTNSNAIKIAAPQPARRAISGLGWVQLGAFARMDNADRAVVTLKNLKLPAARQSLRKGQILTAVLAGPFANGAELARALALVRQHGYKDAYARN